MQANNKLRARALLFGINYHDTLHAKLNGCVNDANNMAKFLETQFNMPVDVYTDDSNYDDTTCVGITRNLYELALKSHTENLDLVWIHYSGHGSYITDTTNDEKDGCDECLVPVDFEKCGMITDDQISRIFKYFNPRTRVIAVFDCCHSGTIADVKYSWETEKKVTIENILCNIPGKIMTLSGCMDNQTSADAYNVMGDNKYVGALTSCLLMVFKETPAASKDAFQLLAAVRAKLKQRGFVQIPKLCSTYNMARDRMFLP